MKKILFIEGNNDGTIGGSYYSLLYLIQGLDKSKYQPYVVFYQDHALLSAYQMVTPFVKVVDWGTSLARPARSFLDRIRWPYDLWMDVFAKQRKVNHILSEIQPDLVHLNNSYAAMHEWMLACYRRNIRIIAHDRGVPSPSGLRKRIFARVLDASISVSAACRDNVIRQKLPIKRVRQIYNGMDLTNITRAQREGERDTLIRSLGIKSGKVLIGIVGNVDRWKGQHVVLQAIDEVRKRIPAIHCLIVGKTVRGAESYERELKHYISAHSLEDHVTFTGFRQDSVQVMDLLEVVIHASVESEPLGRVILEAMALGKPIVATALGGPLELIVHMETGMLIPPADPGRLAEAICWYLGNPTSGQEMGERGRERLANNFSVERMVRETEALYQEVFSA